MGDSWPSRALRSKRHGRLSIRLVVRKPPDSSGLVSLNPTLFAPSFVNCRRRISTPSSGKYWFSDAPWPAIFGDKTSRRDNEARHLITTRRSVPNDSVAITAALAEGALQLAADPRNACPIKVVE